MYGWTLGSKERTKNMARNPKYTCPIKGRRNLKITKSQKLTAAQVKHNREHAKIRSPSSMLLADEDFPLPQTQDKKPLGVAHRFLFLDIGGSLEPKNII
jgi:hypothetical protein